MKIYVSLLLCLFVCGGCNMFSKKDNTPMPEFNTIKDITTASKTIQESSEDISESSSKIVSSAEKIKQQTGKIRNTSFENEVEKIQPELISIEKESDSIVQNAHNIDKSISDLHSATSLLDNAKNKVESIEKVLNQITKERDDAIKEMKKAQEAKNSALHTVLRWLIVGCIVLTGVFAVLFIIHGSKLGLTGAAMCGVVCALAIFVETYFIYIAIAGGVILLLLIVALVYNIMIQKRAFKEVVDTVEIVQDNLPVETKEKLFGGEGETGIMDTIQSKSTMNLVKKEKQKIDKLWLYAKNKKTGETKAIHPNGNSD